MDFLIYTYYLLLLLSYLSSTNQFEINRQQLIYKPPPEREDFGRFQSDVVTYANYVKDWQPGYTMFYESRSCLIQEKPKAKDEDELLVQEKPKAKGEDELLVQEKPKAKGEDELLVQEKPKAKGEDELLVQEKPKAKGEDELLVKEKPKAKGEQSEQSSYNPFTPYQKTHIEDQIIARIDYHFDALRGHMDKLIEDQMKIVINNLRESNKKAKGHNFMGFFR